MTTINVSINLKAIDQLTDADLLALLDNMMVNKAGLMIFAHYSGDEYSYKLLNDYIMDQEDVENFVENYYHGDLDALTEYAECFVADRYAEYYAESV